MSTATSAYLNRPCRSLADAERTLREFRNERILAGFIAGKVQRTTMPPIGDTTAVQPIGSPAIAVGRAAA